MVSGPLLWFLFEDPFINLADGIWPWQQVYLHQRSRDDLDPSFVCFPLLLCSQMNRLSQDITAINRVRLRLLETTSSLRGYPYVHV